MGRYRRLMVQVASADQPGGLDQAMDRSRDAARQPDADGQRQEHAGEEERHQENSQLVAISQQAGSRSGRPDVAEVRRPHRPW